MEMINELVVSIDEKLFDDLPTCLRVDTIQRALFGAAGIPRPDRSTPDWKLGEEPAPRSPARGGAVMEGLAAILALGCLGYFVWYCIYAVRSLSSPLPPKDRKTGGGLLHHEPPAPPPAGDVPVLQSLLQPVARYAAMTDPAAFTIALGLFSIVSVLCPSTLPKTRGRSFTSRLTLRRGRGLLEGHVARGRWVESALSSAPPQPAPPESHRPGLPSPAQADQPARRGTLASVLDSLIDRRAALRVDSDSFPGPAGAQLGPG